MFYLPLEKLTANFNLNSIKIESPISLHQVGICSCFVAFKSTEKKNGKHSSYKRSAVPTGTMTVYFQRLIFQELS